MARRRKPTPEMTAIIEKAKELSELLEKLPDTHNNVVARYNVNQALRYLVVSN